jgi:hypothetical protein
MLYTGTQRVTIETAEIKRTKVSVRTPIDFRPFFRSNCLKQNKKYYLELPLLLGEGLYRVAAPTFLEFLKKRKKLLRGQE